MMGSTISKETSPRQAWGQSAWNRWAVRLAAGGCATAVSFGGPSNSFATGLSAMHAPKPALRGLVVEDVHEEGPAEEALDALPGSRPGFQLPQAIDPEADYLSDFTKLIDSGEWGKAFRLLTELSDEQLGAIAPVGEALVFAPVSVQVRERVSALAPDGMRAFRLYFDAQANEQFKAVQNHPLPGSDAQLALIQGLIDRFYATTVGAQAAVMAGDVFFERGQFAQAERCWALAVDHDETQGDAIPDLQARRVMALNRAGKHAKAAVLLSELSARYETLPIQLGDQQVDALKLLSGMLADTASSKQAIATADTDKPLALPQKNDDPIWRLLFLDEATHKGFANHNNNYYRTPQDLKRLVPQVVADDERVYFAYQGIPFALDRDGGKILWTTDRIANLAEGMNERLNSNASDPRNYRIAQSEQTLLVNTPLKLGQNDDEYFTLVGYDKQTGQERWSSSGFNTWDELDGGGSSKTPVSILGQPLVLGQSGYVVVHRAGFSECYLRCFNPDTGVIAWTIPLGQAQPISFQYSNVKRMPQPVMLASDELLHVLVGTGALVTVDPAAQHIKWALHMDLPFGYSPDDASLKQHNAFTNAVEHFCNPNGANTLLLKDGRLYAKQHLGSTLYAIDPLTGQVQWQADDLPQSAKLIGVDDQCFYVMDKAIKGFSIAGEHDLVWNNPQDTGKPIHAAALLADDRIMVLGDRRLTLLDTKHGDPVKRYRNDDYLGNGGGGLYRFGDLLVAIDQTQITAFRINPADAATP